MVLVPERRSYRLCRSGVRPKAILACDFDGTLFDGMTPKAEALFETFKTCFPREVSDSHKHEIIQSFFDHGGKSTEDILKGTASKLGLDVGKRLAELTSKQLENEEAFVVKNGRFFDDVHHLEQLKTLGIAVGITTSGKHSLVIKLVRREGNMDLFSFVLGRHFLLEQEGKPFAKGVPHLDILKRFLRERGMPPVYYYGDAHADLDTALKVGAEKIFMREGTLSREKILEGARARGIAGKVLVVKDTRQLLTHLERMVR